jgi:S1-C subfamily serine protease
LPQLGQEHAVRYYRLDWDGGDMKMLWALALVLASATAGTAQTSSGSGVVINSKGEILTNSHVVEACAEITARLPFDGNIEASAILVARDERNDLAVIRVTRPNIPAPPVAAFRDGDSVRPGDAVVVLGYPLSGLLASTANLSVGNVSAWRCMLVREVEGTSPLDQAGSPA